MKLPKRVQEPIHSSSQRPLQKVIAGASQYSSFAKTQILYFICQKLSCGLSLVSFFIRPFSQQNDTWSMSFTVTLWLTCSFKLFKLVCIRAIPNNSRMLLHSKWMKSRFWKEEKKSNSVLLSAFFTLQWDCVLFFFLYRWEDLLSL